jgi:hypothetical protein
VDLKAFRDPILRVDFVFYNSQVTKNNSNLLNSDNFTLYNRISFNFDQESYINLTDKYNEKHQIMCDIRSFSSPYELRRQPSIVVLIHS